VTMSQRHKKALGRGLGALLSAPGAPAPPPPAEPNPQEQPLTTVGTLRVRLEDVLPNPRQPRREFAPEALDDLAQSIREHGVLQPILVTQAPGASGFVLVAGERRLRASEIAGVPDIPVRLVEADDRGRLEVAIVENVQREDLNPIEEAHAYQELASSFGYTQERIAERVGKSRVAVANALRLLKLPENCLRDLNNGLITAGHARALLMLHHPLQQEQLRTEILDRQLSVREAEDRARAIQEARDAVAGEGKPKKTKLPHQQSLDVVHLQEKWTLCLGCKVRIRARPNGSGKVEIEYSSLDDLDRINALIGVSPDD